MFISKQKRAELEKAFRANYVTFKDIKEWFLNNEEGIREYNSLFLPKIPMMGAATTFMALIVSFFHEAIAESRLLYVMAYAMCLMFFVATRRGRVKKYVLAYLYASSIVMYVLVLFLSVIKGPDYPAAAMLVMLSVFPILFIDKPQRFLAVEIMFYVVHSFCAYVVKGPELGQIDIVNGFVATLVGCFLGWFILISRLRALDLERLLIIEKETDALTGLYNRRKLFEMIGAIEKGECSKPSGVIMLDIDYFKKYNDTNGHVAGDACLRAFGGVLLNGNWDSEIEFYRYGGEEFVALIWKADAKKIGEVSEKIRASVETLNIEYGKITTSIGYVYCSEPTISNYETWIERADAAAYLAKSNGRNCVVQAETKSDN